MARIEINTADYEQEHGSKPRGTGTWAYQVHLEDGQGAYSLCGNKQTAAGITWTQAQAAMKSDAKNELSGCGRATYARVYVGA